MEGVGGDVLVELRFAMVLRDRKSGICRPGYGLQLLVVITGHESPASEVKSQEQPSVTTTEEAQHKQ